MKKIFGFMLMAFLSATSFASDDEFTVLNGADGKTVIVKFDNSVTHDARMRRLKEDKAWNAAYSKAEFEKADAIQDERERRAAKRALMAKSVAAMNNASTPREKAADEEFTKSLRDEFIRVLQAEAEAAKFSTISEYTFSKAYLPIFEARILELRRATKATDPKDEKSLDNLFWKTQWLALVINSFSQNIQVDEKELTAKDYRSFKKEDESYNYLKVANAAIMEALQKGGFNAFGR